MTKSGNKEESLSNRYKKMFEELEKQGQDINSVFKQLGEKEALLQRIQDVEDDVAEDQTEIFKQAYSDGDIRRCVRTVINIAKEDWLYYRRGLRKTLYTEGNLFKNPLNYGFNTDDYEKTRQILLLSISNIDRLSKAEDSYIPKERAESSCKELVQLIFLYECLYINRVQNEKRLNESAFLKLSLPQIFQSFLVFFQSQYNLAREKMANIWHSQEYITGFESQVASERSAFNPDVFVSLGDSFEQSLEDIDTLFRYIFYLKSGETVSADDAKKGFTSSYVSPEYSMLDVLSMLDVFFSRMEASFRYSEWNIGIAKNPDGKECYCFFPSDEKPYKTHIAAGLRNKHNFMVEAANENMKEIMNGQPQRMSGSSDGAKQLPGGFYSEYLSVSKNLDVKNIEEFHFDREDYNLLVSYVEPVIASTRKRNKPYYFMVRFNDMCVDEYLDTYVFLYTLSKVFYCAAVKYGIQEDLVPMIDLDYLYNEYATVSGLKKEKARKLINFYVFDKTVARDKRAGDVFTNPLISVGTGMVLLSEGLMDQVNLDRNIEVFLDRNNVDLAPMGKELEKKLVEKLQEADNLAVNTNIIKFMAYDGRNVEFDFLATLDDFLIIIEMKSLLRPYDDDELYRRYKRVMEGVDQVNRRVKIVQKDWKKIKELASIKLPNEPYDEEHIIKVVCTDIYDFTSLMFDGVVVTDDATIIKYFTNPYVQGILDMQEKGSKFLKKKVLWGDKGRPSAEELVSYLHNPDTMDYFVECIESEWNNIPVFEEYKPIAFQDMVLKEDPLRHLAEKYHM